MRRKDRALAPDQAYAIIDACEYAVFSCVDDAGEIFSIPLSLARKDERIFIHGASKGAKTQLFTHGRAVTIVCVSYNRVPTLSADDFAAIRNDGKSLGDQVFTTEYTSAIAHTRAREVTDTDEKMAALRLLCEKYTPEYMSAFETAARHSIRHTKIYEFAIERLSAKAKILK